MKIRTRLTAGLGPVWLALCLAGFLPAWVQAQNLADLARKTKKDRQAAPAKKTFTNKDLENAQGSVSSSQVPDQVLAQSKPSAGDPVRRASSSASTSIATNRAGSVQGTAGTMTSPTRSSG